MSNSTEARRYIAVIQDPQGYPATGGPLPTKESAPRPAELITVVRADDYDAAVAVAQAERTAEIVAWLRRPQGMGGDSIRRMADANAIAKEFGLHEDVSL